MFRTFTKKFLPNPFDFRLKRLAKKGGKRILIGWNRGLGDIALGLFAMVERIRTFIPDAEITFVTRHNLYDGFSFLEGVKAIIDPRWKRGERAKIDSGLQKSYDLVIENPSPTDWVLWQLGKITPKLRWDPKHDPLYERFHLPDQCVGVQIATETDHGSWRNWPLEHWQKLFDEFERKNVPVLLFGFDNVLQFQNKNLIDLRGQTTLFELLSIVKHKVKTLILPDSGIATVVYYLNESFPIREITLWADPTQGILKQRVASPNPRLIHRPLIGPNRNLATVLPSHVLAAMQRKVLPILLAGGQGTRLQMQGPKGLFKIAGKTLFQWFCKRLPKGSTLAIMTSPLNHKETFDYFQKNNFLGLNIHFFQQEMEPILDERKEPTGEWGPNGNGSLFFSFAKANFNALFEKMGFDSVTVSYVDNPLSSPLDPALIQGLECGAEVAIQCVERKGDDRSMGVLVENGGKLEVVEYTELDPSKEYKYAYSGGLAFDFSFFCEMGKKELPLHWIQKTVGEKKVWKKEQFIFDVLAFAKRIQPVCVDRNTHYAPIKDKAGIEKADQLLRSL